MIANDCHVEREPFFPEIYPQLRRMAAARMGAQGWGQTLQPTALVHEVWMRLTTAKSRSRWGNATQFIAAASKTMRSILVDRARARSGLKRGGGWSRVPMEDAATITAGDDDRMVLIHDAIARLEGENPVSAQVVVFKFFGGFSNREIADEMSLAERTVERYWAHAKAWLYDEITLQQR